MRIDIRRALRRGMGRFRSGWWPVVLASGAAACSWLIAHRWLGHPQPFFAPIAAVISLSTSSIQRSRRISQMVAGVLLGIRIGELLSSAMMFANQAAASATLVVTVHRVGTGGERAVDVLVGAGWHLCSGCCSSPADPLARSP